jgi:predicted amidohydrolase
MTAIACCQLAPQIGEVEANRAMSFAAVADAASRGAEIVVLPELINSGYVFSGAEEGRALAEPLDGESVSGWSELAREHELVIVAGLCERDEHGAVRNSSVIVEPSGLRGVYRKAHLWDREKLVFEPGTEPPLVVDTDHGRIATMVCYDAEFPEWVRLVALAGAELLCVPTNWPRGRRPAGERPPEVVRVQASAGINRIFIAAADRVGRERGVDWFGGTTIVDPEGFPLAGPAGDEEEITLLAECDLALAREKRTSEHNDALADRRPQLYGALSEAAGALASGRRT